MEKRRKAVLLAVILSETSHLFCCVLPTIFSVLSLFVGIGMISVMPAPLSAMHAILHAWELPIISLSGLILALGWGIDIHSRKVDCHDTGCHHPPCDVRKDKAHLVLKLATVLFLANVMVYTVLHQGMGVGQPAAVEQVDHHNGHDH